MMYATGVTVGDEMLVAVGSGVGVWVGLSVDVGSGVG